MVQKRIFNDVRVSRRTILPVETYQELENLVPQQVEEADSDELIGAHNLAMTPFLNDPTITNVNNTPSAMSITVGHLLNHSLAPKSDQLALHRLFGKNKKAHPSMLLDEKILQGPKNAPKAYLNHRYKVLQIDKHQVGQSFMKDLLMAIDMKQDSSDRKKLQKLSQSLNKRFESLSF